MLRKHSVLIVDADAYLAGIYARRFEGARWHVRVAETGEEARKAVDRRLPDAVLIDIETVADSLDLLRGWHAREKTAGMTLVALTHLGDQIAIAEAREAGASGYLLKGHFVPRSVCEKVMRLVAERGQG